MNLKLVKAASPLSPCLADGTREKPFLRPTVSAVGGCIFIGIDRQSGKLGVAVFPQAGARLSDVLFLFFVCLITTNSIQVV